MKREPGEGVDGVRVGVPLINSETVPGTSNTLASGTLGSGLLLSTLMKNGILDGLSLEGATLDGHGHLVSGSLLSASAPLLSAGEIPLLSNSTLDANILKMVEPVMEMNRKLFPPN